MVMCSVIVLLLFGITCRITLTCTSGLERVWIICGNFCKLHRHFILSKLTRQILCKLHYWTSSGKTNPAQIMFKAQIQTGLVLHWELRLQVLFSDFISVQTGSVSVFLPFPLRKFQPKSPTVSQST